MDAKKTASGPKRRQPHPMQTAASDTWNVSQSQKAVRKGSNASGEIRSA
jgi:hypothetical protein